MELRDKEYDDPNAGGVGMQMFTEALMQLNDCSKLFYEVKKENTDIEERLYKLENMVSGIDTVYDLSNDVGELRTRIEMFQPTLNSLEGRIDDIESRILKLETNLGYLIKANSDLTNTLSNYAKSADLNNYVTKNVFDDFKVSFDSKVEEINPDDTPQIDI